MELALAACSELQRRLQHVKRFTVEAELGPSDQERTPTRQR